MKKVTTKKKNNLQFIIFLVILLVLIIGTIYGVGVSFGFFNYVKEGEVVNIVTIRGLESEILNEDDEALNLINAYPMYNSDGINQTPFEFNVTNTSTASFAYTMKVVFDEEKQAECTLSEEKECQALATDYIKFIYAKNDGTYSEPQTLLDTGNIISDGIISGGETIKSSIIIWVDSEAGNEIKGKYFFGKIIIEGTHVPLS